MPSTPQKPELFSSTVKLLAPPEELLELELEELEELLLELEEELLEELVLELLELADEELELLELELEEELLDEFELPPSAVQARIVPEESLPAP